MTRRAKRTLLGIGIAAVALVGAGGYWVYAMMQQAMYQVGIVRAEQGLRGPLDPPKQPDDANHWRVENDIELYHMDFGKGTPVLFVHGGPGFPTHTLPAGLAALTDAFEIHLYDQRGCGKSTRPIDKFESSNYYQNMMQMNGALGIAAHIADIERIRRILGRDKLVLVGHSFGGFIATLYAAEFPERVAALVLVAPADMLLFPSEKGDLFKIMREKLPEADRSNFDAFLRRYFDFGTVFTKSEADLVDVNLEFAKFFRMANGETPAAESEGNGSGAKSAADDDFAKSVGGWVVPAIYFSLGRQHDYRDAVQKVNVPTLIIHGEQDLVPVASSRSYADVLPNARLEVIEGADHFVMEEKPEVFAKLVREFITSAMNAAPAARTSSAPVTGP